MSYARLLLPTGSGICSLGYRWNEIPPASCGYLGIGGAPGTGYSSGPWILTLGNGSLGSRRAYEPAEGGPVDDRRNAMRELQRMADRAFERMVSMLAPGGKLYIEVPDQLDLYIPGHLWHFTGETLRLWANVLGLEDVQVDVRYPSGRPNLDYHLNVTGREVLSEPLCPSGRFDGKPRDFDQAAGTELGNWGKSGSPTAQRCRPPGSGVQLPGERNWLSDTENSLGARRGWRPAW